MDNELKQYIAKHKSLFWYTPENKKEEIGNDLLVETILNYGRLEDIKELIQIMGINSIADVFFSAKERMKLNYYPEIYNFFNIVFTRYAQRNS
jgi:hypothetical protein